MVVTLAGTTKEGSESATRNNISWFGKPRVINDSGDLPHG